VTLDESDQARLKRMESLPPGVRTALLRILGLPDFHRADRVTEFWSHFETPESGQLLIDLDEDRPVRAVVLRLRAEMDRKS